MNDASPTALAPLDLIREIPTDNSLGQVKSRFKSAWVFCLNPRSN
jgi:hypothetical protein